MSVLRRISEHIDVLLTTPLPKRLYIQVNSSSPQGYITASKEDPWVSAGKYSLYWTYFAIAVLGLCVLQRIWITCRDVRALSRYRKAVKEMAKPHWSASPSEYRRTTISTANTQRRASFVDVVVAFARWIFYRQIPELNIWKFHLGFAPLWALGMATIAFVFAALWCFCPQPYYYASIRFGSPPLAIRAGMLAVAMMPWIVGLGVAANPISLLTGIGHERLGVFHRWLAYIFLFLSLVHMIPFYVTPVWTDGAWPEFKKLFSPKYIVYGTGVASIVPLFFLCVHSLPVFRNRVYELFKFMHAPVAVVLLGMLFWHCHDFLTSWNYLFATVAVWAFSYVLRLFYLNWVVPWRMSWLIGEEAAVTVLAENALKVTVPTKQRWRPGQYVYLRMPGISVLGNHPFTIASLCSDELASTYAPEYKDLTMVFRPYRGFTRAVLDSAVAKGPCKTYRAFLDGPYGGMRRNMAAFDTVVLIAGGSGITAVLSHLYDLIRRMRDEKAVTKRVHLIWAMKRPEIIQWFEEEIRICREYAPHHAMTCQIHITAPRQNIGSEAINLRQLEKFGRYRNVELPLPLPCAHVRGSVYEESRAGECVEGVEVCYGRPNISVALKRQSFDFKGRTCVFVCGPQSMRIDVANCVAGLQQRVWRQRVDNEIVLQTENYAI